MTDVAPHVPRQRERSEPPARGQVPFPRYAVALLQSESEMVQVPQYDLLPALEHEERCDVELFTERTVHALLDSPGQFDCVVVGYNATHKSPEIHAALSSQPMPVGLLVLHQLKPEALSFLDSADSLGAVSLEPAADAAVVPQELDPHDEIVLNWPERRIVEGRGLPHARSYLGFRPETGGDWRAVLETDGDFERLAVLVRTDRRSSSPVAVSSVLLAPRRAQHFALLVNLILWCSAGRPTAVVVGEDGAPETAIIHRKLRMQGVRAVSHEVAGPKALDFHDWPLWGTEAAVLPETWDPTRAAGWPERDPHRVKPWLRRGHRVVLLGPGTSLTVRHGESDAHWVASRWAKWFNAAPSETWHGGRVAGSEFAGSIVATRSILRMLAALHGTSPKSTLPGLTTVHRVLADLAQAGGAITPASLGVPEPRTYIDPVATLVARRLGPDNSVDGTVSATAAVLDLDELLDRAALGDRREDVERWLRKQLEDCALEDRLEIARCLGDAQLLEAVIAGAVDDVRVDQPASAVLVTALRFALVACHAGTDVDLAPFRLDPERAVVDRELAMRPMLAAGYLLGVLDLQRLWHHDDADGHGVLEEPARSLCDPPDDRLDRAVVTLGRYGPLSQDVTGATAPVPELASTEALALIAYFARYPVPTHALAGFGEAPRTSHALLAESERVRSENRELAAGLSGAMDRATRAGPALALFSEALIIALVVLFTVVLAPHIPEVWAPPTALALWAVLTLGLLALLSRYELRVPWATRIAPWLAEGLPALRKDLARGVAGTPAPDAAVSADARADESRPGGSTPAR